MKNRVVDMKNEKLPVGQASRLFCEVNVFDRRDAHSTKWLYIKGWINDYT